MLNCHYANPFLPTKKSEGQSGFCKLMPVVEVAAPQASSTPYTATQSNKTPAPVCACAARSHSASTTSSDTTRAHTDPVCVKDIIRWLRYTQDDFFFN